MESTRPMPTSPRQACRKNASAPGTWRTRRRKAAATAVTTARAAVMVSCALEVVFEVRCMLMMVLR
jgi:hypothetical protein